MAKWSGGCACGAIRYTCEGEPAMMLNCHCRDCQRATGSAYAAFAVFPKAAVSLKGEPRYHKVTGGSGKPIERGFCASCGNPVMVRLDVVPDVIGFHAASLDDPSMYKPTMDLFTGSAHPWDVMQPDTMKKAGGLAG
jgi:hypothetical protein